MSSNVDQKVAERTPTPWSVVGARYIGATEFAGIANAAKTELVADNLKKVDAEFIVAACNAHPVLMTALRKAREWFVHNNDTNHEAITGIVCAALDGDKPDYSRLPRGVLQLAAEALEHSKPKIPTPEAIERHESARRGIARLLADAAI